MNARKIPIRLILTFIIGYEIQVTYGKPGSSTTDDLTQEEMSAFLLQGETGSWLLNKISENLSNSSDRSAKERVSWWNSLNKAIDDFIREFESQNKTSKIRVDRQLKTTDWPITHHDGFSRRYRLDFSFQKGEKEDVQSSSVIVVIPELGLTYQQGKNMLLYNKERYMFEKVLPLMYPSWEREKFSPNFYASTESGMLIVENLHDGLGWQQLDAENSSRLHSEDECKLVFGALARFHALSIAHLDKTVYSNLDSLTPVNELVDNTVRGYTGMEMATNYVERMSKKLSPSMQDEIRSTIENLNTVTKSAYSRSANGFDVVLQGFPVKNNLFFQLDDGGDEQSRRVTRCKFIDFRSSRLGSPVLDLMIYLLSSVEFKVFEEKGDSLFDFYLEELRRNLADLNQPATSLQYDLAMLRADLRRYKSYFIYMLIDNVPLQWEGRQTVEASALLELRVNALQSEKYVSFFENWMNAFSTW